MIATVAGSETAMTQERLRLAASSTGAGQPADRAKEVAAPNRRQDAVEIRLSDQARKALDPANPALKRFSNSITDGLIGLGRQSTSMFTSLGMSPANAKMAMGAVSQAVRAVAGSPPVHAEVVAFSASGQGGADGDYRASLVIKKAGVYWDPASSSFVMTSRNVTVSVDLGSGPAITPQGPPPPVSGLVPVQSVDIKVPVQV